jgi:2-oxoglutarate ferredoxin oxidoreductase subunit gamma
MSETSIRFSGFGGQGIILSAVILAFGTAIYEKRSVVQTQSYGVESRGGSCTADVIISDKAIAYPLVECADFLISLSQEAVNKYIPAINKYSLVIVDPVFVQELPEGLSGRVVEVPAAEMADKLGNRLVSNMIVLGVLSGLSSVISLESLEKSIKRNTNRALHDINISAANVGFKFAGNLE